MKKNAQGNFAENGVWALGTELRQLKDVARGQDSDSAYKMHYRQNQRDRINGGTDPPGPVGTAAAHL
jgi:hypothetical protein